MGHYYSAYRDFIYLQDELLQRCDGDLRGLVRLQVLVKEVGAVQAIAVPRARPARSALNIDKFVKKIP